MSFAKREQTQHLQPNPAFLTHRSAGVPQSSASMAVLVQQLFVPEVSFVLHSQRPRDSNPDYVLAEVAPGESSSSQAMVSFIRPESSVDCLACLASYLLCLGLLSQGGARANTPWQTCMTLHVSDPRLQPELVPMYLQTLDIVLRDGESSSTHIETTACVMCCALASC